MYTTEENNLKQECRVRGEPAGEKAADDRCGEKAPRRAYAPAVDIVESAEAVELVVDVPGVAEGAVDLTLEKNVLSLSAVPVDGVVAGRTLCHGEYGAGEYRRAFALSEDVDRERISASLKNGVLRIRLPKTAPVTRKIAIAAS